MSLWRIPLILIAWASYIVAYTPPTPPAQANAQASYKNLSWGAARIQKDTVVRVKLQKAFVSAVMLAEIAFASGSPQAWMWVPYADGQQSFLSPLFMVGVACALSGALVRLWSYHTMCAHFTFQLSLLKNHELITGGPYAYVRHPAYTALLFTVCGVLLCEVAAGSWWVEAHVFSYALGKGIAGLAVGCVVMSVLVVSRAAEEDRTLHRAFGAQWKEWAADVPYRFIPGVL